jgi:hypothetical protein
MTASENERNACSGRRIVKPNQQLLSGAGRYEINHCNEGEEGTSQSASDSLFMGRELPFRFRKPSEPMKQKWTDAPDVRCCPKSSGEQLPRRPTPNSSQSMDVG